MGAEAEALQTQPAGLTRDEFILMQLTEIRGELKTQTAMMAGFHDTHTEHAASDVARFTHLDEAFEQIQQQRTADLQLQAQDAKAATTSGRQLNMGWTIGLLAAAFTIGAPVITKILDLAFQTHKP